jgi:hypothetical protein
MKTTLQLFFFVLIFSACAHHKDVRPGTEGIHRVVVQTDDDSRGARNALDQAEHYCKQYGKQPAIVTEDKKYTGDMDEKDYRTGKKVAKAAQTLGGVVWALGGKNESNAGGIVGVGGAVGDQVLGEGYTVEMKFKCQ